MGRLAGFTELKLIIAQKYRIDSYRQGGYGYLKKKKHN